MAYIPNTADIVNNILQGSANVESIIRANSLDQFVAPAANVSWNSKRLTNLAQGIVSTDVPNLAQLVDNQMPTVVSGCVWTADSPGTTRNCSMTSGTVMIAGILLTVAAVTARAFTASNDTYVDLADNGDGTANITYSTVVNNAIPPALANSGTVLNRIRVAVISAGATAVATAGIGQGNVGTVTNAAAVPSTTVAIGSNGAQINVATLNVASGTSFPSSGGWATVAHASGQTYLIQFTGTGATTLTGVTVLAGTPTNTVSTGDAVVGVWNDVTSRTDMLGNIIYPQTRYPGLIGFGQFANNFTTTQTTLAPLQPANGFAAPFIIPAGPGRTVRYTLSIPVFGSSAVAGTVVQLRVYTGNPNSGGSLVYLVAPNVKVASDFDAITMSAPITLAAGSYLATAAVQSGAAGTITAGIVGGNNFLSVDLI